MTDYETAFNDLQGKVTDIGARLDSALRDVTGAHDTGDDEAFEEEATQMAEIINELRNLGTGGNEATKGGVLPHPGNPQMEPYRGRRQGQSRPGEAKQGEGPNRPGQGPMPTQHDNPSNKPDEPPGQAKKPDPKSVEAQPPTGGHPGQGAVSSTGGSGASGPKKDEKK